MQICGKRYKKLETGRNHSGAASQAQKENERETRSQKKLDAEERKKNLRNAFQASGPVTGLRILVVDDVYTTGSTVEAMAECLLENGAKAVFFVTLCTGNI